MKEAICIHCGEGFKRSPRHRNQEYCQNAECRKVGKAKWQKEKMRSDPDYRKNQKESYASWAKNNSDYWKKYRVRNPDKAQRNRLLQKVRNSRKKSNAAQKHCKMDPSQVAKMDPSNPYPWPEGVFYLIPVIAKMDPLKAQLFDISKQSCRNNGYYLIAKKDSLETTSKI